MNLPAEFPQFENLLAAARQLVPANRYMTADMPDDEVINLITTVGAIRQITVAVITCDEGVA